MFIMKDDKFTMYLPDDTPDPDALYKQWSVLAPSVWDGYVVNDFELPKGSDPLYSPKQLELKSNACECGAHKTYGNDCAASFHSDYCPLYEGGR
jgi:hypothetical protein